MKTLTKKTESKYHKMKYTKCRDLYEDDDQTERLLKDSNCQRNFSFVGLLGKKRSRKKWDKSYMR
jgi:hypothetical protein